MLDTEKSEEMLVNRKKWPKRVKIGGEFLVNSDDSEGKKGYLPC